MELIFLGYPGSGKGTQAWLISDRYHIPMISTGHALRAAVADETKLGLQAKKYMDAGELVPDDVIIGLVSERLNQPDSSEGFILDGFPRTVYQAEKFDDYLTRTGRSLLTVVHLEVEKEAVIERLIKRRVCEKCGSQFHLTFKPPPENFICPNCNGKIIQRSDDNPETVRNRLDVYEQATMPLIGYYEKQGKVLAIDGGKSIEDVHWDITPNLVRMAIKGS